MSLPKKNIFANVAGQAWSAVIGIVFVPIYIRYMGIEAYGLVGFFTTIQSLFVIVDMGLTTTMSREIARLMSLKNFEDEMFSTTRTLEYLYWFMAVCFGALVVLLAPLIANKWLNVEHISHENANYAIMLMGFSFMLQLPSSVYSGGLAGLQKQIVLNKINIVVSTLRSMGALVMLIVLENKILAFFGWQIISSFIQTFLMSYSFKRLLPIRGNCRVRFWETVGKIWRFTVGVSVTTFMAIIFMQVDKIVISKYFSLKQFAYYSLASSLATTVYRAVVPVTGVMMPRFTELIALNDENGLIKSYHHACQLISFLIMPAIGVGVLFSHEILTLWTRDVSISDNTYIILSLLLIGTMLNSLYHIPYNLQLAYGWNKLGLYSTAISALLVVPMSIFSVMKFGLVGPAAIWVIFNLCYILLAIPIMHRKLLVSEKKTWYLLDIIAPMISSFVVVLIWRVLSYLPAFQLFEYLPAIYRTLPFIILSFISSYVVSAYSLPLLRHKMKIGLVRVLNVSLFGGKAN